MTDQEFDQIYEESRCNGSRDAIIAYLFDDRKRLIAEVARLTKQLEHEHNWDVRPHALASAFHFSNPCCKA